jgi:hypothetical protein
MSLLGLNSVLNPDEDVDAKDDFLVLVDEDIHHNESSCETNILMDEFKHGEYGYICNYMTPNNITLNRKLLYDFRQTQ